MVDDVLRCNRGCNKCGFPNQNSRIGSSWEFACTWRSRLKGLLFKHPSDVVLVLISCSDIHTFGMKHALDVAFVSREGFVLEAHKDVKPNRRLRCKGAAMVVERFASDKTWFEVGNQVEFSLC